MSYSKGRPRKLGIGLAPAKCKYVCNVEGCNEEIISYDLAKHYIRKGNSEMLDRLINCPVESGRKAILEKADPHTIYLFTNGYTSMKLPD